MNRGPAGIVAAPASEGATWIKDSNLLILFGLPGRTRTSDPAVDSAKGGIASRLIPLHLLDKTSVSSSMAVARGSTGQCGAASERSPNMPYALPGTSWATP
jgi:hypothetical protein